MTTYLPESLRPSATDLARDEDLARQAKAIVGQVQASSGVGIKWNTDTYSSTRFGADGSVVSRVVNGVAQQSPEQEAVAGAQAAANADLMRLGAELSRIETMRDEISGYERDGSPRYVRKPDQRASLDKQARSLRLGYINQTRLNERRWREEAAPAVNRAEQTRELARELEAQGKFQRRGGW